MSTVLALDTKLSKHMRLHMPGRVVEYLGASLEGVPPKEWAEEGPAQLLALIEQERPDALVLGVRLGGNQYLAMDALALLLSGEDRMGSPPAVVLLAPSVTMALAKRAWQLGAFAMVDASLFDSHEELAGVLATAALRAQAWRLGAGNRLLESPESPAAPRPRLAPRRLRPGRKRSAR